MTRLLDPIVVVAHRLGYQGERLGHTSCGFVSNCPVSEAWKTEASWPMHVRDKLTILLSVSNICIYIYNIYIYWTVILL